MKLAVFGITFYYLLQFFFASLPQKPPRPIQCNGTTTILELKQAINSLVGIPVEQQSLYFQGIQLKDDRASLIEAGINEIAEVELREEITPARFKGST